MVIGIDVGSKRLDAAATAVATGGGPALPPHVPNTEEGIAPLVRALGTLPPAVVVMEATGNDHRPLLARLLAASVPVAVVNPAQVAAFRQSRLGRHQTDRGDAQLRARLAEVHHDELRRATPEEPDVARLRAMVGYRDDLVARRTRLRNQRHAAQWAGPETVLAWLEEDLAAVTRRLAEVKRDIEAVLALLPEAAVLTRQIGVGTLVAAAVRASLPAGVLGHAKAAAAYAGRHPRQEQSGDTARSRLSKQGAPPLRRSLYQAALAAIRCDPDLGSWYAQLCARGKPPKSARCAVAHKILRRLMGRLQVFRAAQEEVSMPLAA